MNQPKDLKIRPNTSTRLGDNVFAHVGGGSLLLCANHHDPEQATDNIYLDEPEVEALAALLERLKNERNPQESKVPVKDLSKTDRSGSSFHMGDGTFARQDEHGALVITTNLHDPHQPSNTVCLREDSIRRLAVYLSFLDKKEWHIDLNDASTESDKANVIVDRFRSEFSFLVQRATGTAEALNLSDAAQSDVFMQMHDSANVYSAIRQAARKNTEDPKR